MDFLNDAIDPMLLLLLLSPLIIIDLGARVYAIIDMHKTQRVLRGSKTMWLVLVILVNFAWVAYFLAGRDES